eukprot:CAMPEP_0203824126 /NCGR_PEP_ID=MMETSP0115-20131106/51034_1 /ASSEMBLY_ACC=CAM_ASM_000227 /TAXON_ID=33651 /ORGANISM="Bicosoecid sp, Strain ms1" /LENGTH=41 /DNA_ID= /DNA_START= /DNA_END= /DNA_ORIENTATION=
MKQRQRHCNARYVFGNTWRVCVEGRRLHHARHPRDTDPKLL